MYVAQVDVLEYANTIKHLHWVCRSAVEILYQEFLWCVGRVLHSAIPCEKQVLWYLSNISMICVDLWLIISMRVHSYTVEGLKCYKVTKEHVWKSMAQCAKEFSTKGKTQPTDLESLNIDFSHNVLIGGRLFSVHGLLRPWVFDSFDRKQHLSLVRDSVQTTRPKLIVKI